jgi:hypothetical protein
VAGGQVGKWAVRQIQMEVYRWEGEKQIDRQTDGDTDTAIQINTETNRQMQT